MFYFQLLIFFFRLPFYSRQQSLLQTWSKKRRRWMHRMLTSRGYWMKWVVGVT